MEVGQILPAGHVAHTPTPASAYSPALHAVCTLPEQLWPAAHAEHAAAPAELISVAPQATQSVDAVAAGAVRYVPAKQACLVVAPPSQLRRRGKGRFRHRIEASKGSIPKLPG